MGELAKVQKVKNQPQMRLRVPFLKGHPPHEGPVGNNKAENANADVRFGLVSTRTASTSISFWQCIDKGLHVGPLGR